MGTKSTSSIIPFIEKFAIQVKKRGAKRTKALFFRYKFNELVLSFCLEPSFLASRPCRSDGLWPNEGFFEKHSPRSLGATVREKDEIRVQNVKNAGKGKIQDEFNN